MLLSALKEGILKEVGLAEGINRKKSNNKRERWELQKEVVMTLKT